MTAPSPFTETTATARYRAFEELSAAGPVQQVTLFTGVAVWLITGYAEVRQVLASPDVVKSPLERPHADHIPADLVEAMNRHLLTANPPDHTRLRKLVSAAFTRRRVEHLAPRIAEISAGLLDAIPTGTPVDLVAGYSYPLPIIVISELLGVPELRRDAFRRLSAISIGGAMHPPEVYQAAVVEMIAMVRELIAEKRTNPQDDLLSALIEAHEGSDRLTDDELSSMVFLLLVAGHETTVNLITNATHALLTHPEQLEKLRADRSLIPAAVEEVLRYDGAAMVTIPGHTVAPVQVGDVVIPAGEVLVPVLATANRDPGKFDSPAELDLTRPDNQHIGFGHGIHHCLGAPLARLEAKIAIGHLLDRYPGLRLADPDQEPARPPGLLLNGISRLDVIID